MQLQLYLGQYIRETHSFPGWVGVLCALVWLICFIPTLGESEKCNNERT